MGRMMKSLSAQLHSISTGTVTLVALLILILFMALVLPSQSTRDIETNTGATTPDLSIFYSPDELYRMAGDYGPEGRAAFIRVRWTFDVAWPLVYTFFLVTSISWLVGKSFPAASGWQLTNLVPVLAAALDFLENISNSIVMARYPIKSPIFATLAPFFTLFKWLAVGASFAVLFIGLVAAMLVVFRRKSTGA